ncbi:MAG: hypothetical protein RLZZ330_112 [Actinomycetota bacterium]|jgi:Flp pilus assembly protein TadB
MGSLLGLIFGCGFALSILNIQKAADTQEKRSIPEKYWPQFCDDISAGIRAGLSFPESFWQASNSLPLFLQLQFVVIQNRCEAGEPFSATVLEFSERLENKTFSRIVHLATTAQSQNVSAIAGLMNDFSQNLRSDIALLDEIKGKQVVAKISAKVAAFAPLVVLALTSTRQTVRDAFMTTTGLFVISGTMIVTLGSYLLMRNISRIEALND